MKDKLDKNHIILRLLGLALLAMSFCGIQSASAEEVFRSDYQILGINEGTSPSKAKTAYRLLAKKLHPDSNPDLPKDERDAREEEFKLVNDAYDRIKAGQARTVESDARTTAPESPEFNDQEFRSRSYFENLAREALKQPSLHEPLQPDLNNKNDYGKYMAVQDYFLDLAVYKYSQLKNRDLSVLLFQYVADAFEKESKNLLFKSSQLDFLSALIDRLLHYQNTEVLFISRHSLTNSRVDLAQMGYNIYELGYTKKRSPFTTVEIADMVSAAAKAISERPPTAQPIYRWFTVSSEYDVPYLQKITKAKPSYEWKNQLFAAEPKTPSEALMERANSIDNITRPVLDREELVRLSKVARFGQEFLKSKVVNFGHRWKTQTAPLACKKVFSLE